jgi:hypothetical protein
MICTAKYTKLFLLSSFKTVATFAYFAVKKHGDINDT